MFLHIPNTEIDFLPLQIAMVIWNTISLARRHGKIWIKFSTLGFIPKFPEITQYASHAWAQCRCIAITVAVQSFKETWCTEHGRSYVHYCWHYTLQWWQNVKIMCCWKAQGYTFRGRLDYLAKPPQWRGFIHQIHLTKIDCLPFAHWPPVLQFKVKICLATPEAFQ